jgi:hypothetical protein
MSTKPADNSRPTKEQTEAVLRILAAILVLALFLVFLGNMVYTSFYRYESRTQQCEDIGLVYNQGIQACIEAVRPWNE